MSTFHPSDYQKNNTYAQNQPNDPHQSPQESPTQGAQSTPFGQTSQNPYTGFNYQKNMFGDYSGSPYGMPTQKPKPIYKGVDTLFAWLSIVVCFLLVRSFPVVENTLGGVLTTLLLFGFATCYLLVAKVTLMRKAIPIAVIACLLSLGLITGANHTIQRLIYLFTVAALLYYVYCLCGHAGKRALNDNFLSHATHAVFYQPFAKVDAFFLSLPIRRGNRISTKVMRTIGWAALGLLIAVIPTAVVILLLSYDDQFTELIKNIFSFSLDGVWEYLGDAILGFGIAMFLFSALFSAKWKQELSHGEETKTNGTGCHIFPKALLCAAVTPILAVYLLFFISQGSYYLSAFTGTLPGDLTFAAYARNGFFELCWVTAINTVMLILFNALIRKKEDERGAIQKLYSTLIALFTLVLIATALSKMVLYIGSYGLTQKRVYASWLMLLLAAVFIAVLLAQFIKRIHLIPVAVALCVIFFALVALPDVDGMIASYNVDAYLSGELGDVDVDTIADYGVSSVPALVELKDELGKRSFLSTEDYEIIQKAEAALDEIKKELSEQPDHIFTFNIPTARARALLEE